MIIHIVQAGDNIYSIAEAYGVSVTKLIRDNGLENPYSLVQGQTIVIVYPKEQHIVKEGDTLNSIADEYQISIMQLLRNNSFLNQREYIYPGEILVIRYETERSIMTNGFAYPYINLDTLKKTLPSLTYLSIFNYRSTKEGGMIAYENDSALIQYAKDYGAIPLMMVTTLSARGEPNPEVAYEILLNEEYQERNINEMLLVLKAKEYLGINMVLNYLNATTQEFYMNLIAKTSEILRKEGYSYFVTINPDSYDVTDVGDIDFSGMDQLVDGIILMRFVWGGNMDAPAPVSSNYFNTEYLKHMINYIPADKIKLGISLIGNEWELPYQSGITKVHCLTLDSALALANDVNAIIQFDEVSQTPYFEYYQYTHGYPSRYIVWFTDARTISALLTDVSDYGLNGTGIWNIMVFSAQLWLMVNSLYEIIKLIPDNII